MMAPPVRFAIIGLGYGSTRCEMAARTPGVALTAVVDGDSDRARAHGERYGVPWFSRHEEMLAADLADVVGIYTPSGMHLELARDVAEAGMDVLVTKPIEVSLERTDQLVAACDAAGVELFSEFYLRYYPDNHRLNSAIRTGLLGRMILGEFSFKVFRAGQYYRSDGAWRATRRYNGGGVVMNQTIHAIDQLIWQMGDVHSVQAVTGTFAHEIDVEDTAAAVLTMRSGAIAVLTGTSTFRTSNGSTGPGDIYGGGFTDRVEVNGSLGSATLVDDSLTMVAIEGGAVMLPETTPPVNVLEDISRAITDPTYDSSTLARGDVARRPVEVAMAIYASAREHRPVLIEEGIDQVG